MASQPDMEVLTQRMSLPLETHLPWTLCHRNTLCQKVTMNHLTNAPKRLTLTTPWPNYWNSSTNLRTISQALNLPLNNLHPQQTYLSSQISYNTSSCCSNQPPQFSEEPVHKTMQAYTDTLHTAQRESNLTTTMLQDIPIFDSQDSSKQED